MNLKISEEKRKTIYDYWRFNPCSLKIIAEKFKVSRSMIGLIITKFLKNEKTKQQ